MSRERPVNPVRTQKRIFNKLFANDLTLGDLAFKVFNKENISSEEIGRLRKAAIQENVSTELSILLTGSLSDIERDALVEFVTAIKGEDVSQQGDRQSRGEKHQETSEGGVGEKLDKSLSRKFSDIPYEELTDTQQELYNKYANDTNALEQLNKILIVKGEIQFPQIGLAIQDKDAAKDVNKEMADKVVAKAGTRWRLAKDERGESILDPESSDFDKMILQMPGEDNNEKMANFKLLAGMNGRYWTGALWISTRVINNIVVREFDKGVLRSRHGVHHSGNGHVRLFRGLHHIDTSDLDTIEANANKYRSSWATYIQSSAQYVAIPNSNITKLQSIQSMCDTMIASGQIRFEKREGLGIFTIFDLSGLSSALGLYDASNTFGVEDGVVELDSNGENSVRLSAVRGDMEERPDSKFKDHYREITETYNIGLCSEARMQELLDAIGKYYESLFPNNSLGLTQEEKIAALMCLWGRDINYGRLEDYDEKQGRSYLLGEKRSENRKFSQGNSDVATGQLFLITL